MMPTMKVQYLLKQWNDSGNELVITQNGYWQTRYIEPETTEISVSFMEYDYLVQSLGDQAIQNNHQKRKSRNIRITPIELVERSFSLSKRCYGMDLIRTKLYDTTLTSIALSVFVTNLFKIQSRILFALIYLLELIGLQPADFEPETV